MKKLLVTGAAGLIGSEVCLFFARMGFEVHGVDNNQRAVFFGPPGDTRWNQQRLASAIPGYHHYSMDVRDRLGLLKLVQDVRPSVIVHSAGQPSHDLAAKIPFDDFDTNAVGTMNLLEAARQFAPDAPFLHMSTNKVYGDGPNRIRMKELPARWEFADPIYSEGIPEMFPLDQCTHSLFGASKVAADIMVQEYGRYFGMPTCCLRGGCLTGPSHSAVELHGFLGYLAKCNVEKREYVVFGYQGKQVRDNIHSLDVARFMWEFCQNPAPGRVYNLGGGRENSCSILEAFELAAEFSGQKMIHRYVDQNRVGDHICYYSDLRKMRTDYPRWRITKSLPDIVREIVESWKTRAA